MKDDSLLWALDGTRRFCFISLLSILPLVYTGHYACAFTALLVTFLTACCNAMEDLDPQIKQDIRLNIISPEDILNELEMAVGQEQQTIISTCLVQLTKKYHKQSTLVVEKKQNGLPSIHPTVMKQRKQRLEELSLICQQASYLAMQKCPRDDAVVAGAISLLALLGKREAVRERHVQQADVYGLDLPILCIRNALERAKAYSSHEEESQEEPNGFSRFNDMPIAQQQAELQRKACLWLGALAGDGGLNDQVLQEGGLEIILNAADWYRNHSEVVSWALWALFELCQDNVKRKAALVEQNGVACILQAMDTTVTESVEVARHGLAIIFDIMRTDPQEFITSAGPLIDMYKVKNTALNAGIHEIALAAMTSYPDKTEIMMMGQALLVGTSYGGEIPTFTAQDIS